MQNDWVRKTLIVFIIVMFCTASVVSASNKKSSLLPISLDHGTTLFVGGNGPGNFSTIQAAINASSNGDSIFVYDDSSPYHENLIVEKSITLTGESKETTVIDGNGVSNKGVIFIAADCVNISCFYIKAEANNNQAIVVTKVNYSSEKRDTLQKIRINQNIIKADFVGVSFLFVNHAIIDGNYIEGCQFSGIVLALSSHDMITNNILVNNKNGIALYLEQSPFFRLNFLQNRFGNNTITGNRITSNTIGIQINGGLGTLPTLICGNNIIENEEGISIQGEKTEISKNNFFNNQENAFFTILTLFCFTNRFIENYWNTSMTTPVRINGEFSLVFFYPIYIPRVGSVIEEIQILHVPLIAFDWYPAQKPYNIPG